MDITLSSVVGYLFGIVVVVISLAMFTVSAIAGIALLFAGLLALPVIRRWLRDRADLEFSRWAVVGIVFLLMAVSLVGLGIASDDSTSPEAEDSTNVPSTDTVSIQTTAMPSDTSRTTASTEDRASNTLSSTASASPPEPTATSDTSERTEPSGSDSPGFGLTGDSASPSNPVTNLDVQWSAQTQSSVDPDTSDNTAYYAEDGQKFLVIHMELQNTGNKRVELTPRLFRVAIDGAEYSYQPLRGSSAGGLGQVTLQSGGSYEGWILFSIPADATEGELIVYQDALIGEVSASFEQDTSMPVNVSSA